jgi:hypothetical protein
VGLIREEPDSVREARVTTSGDGTEEGNREVEESIDINEKNVAVKTFPQIKTEREVSVWALCVR